MDLAVGTPLYIVGQECGYCHGKKDPDLQAYSLASYEEKYKAGVAPFQGYPTPGMICCHVYMSTPEVYESMMNRGFRRSGSFLYRQDPLRGCCRSYTIRSNLHMLRPSKDHRHTVNKFVKYICGEPKKGKNERFDLHSIIIQSELSTERFRSVIGPPKFTPEKYALYFKYQTTIHNEDPKEVSEKGFKNFLCESSFPMEYGELRPESYWERLNTWRTKKLSTIRGLPIEGPVHECYYIDDKLVAIAVLDLLPESVSSVYFIWDPDYAHLSLGTLSALRECVLTEQLSKKYYYLGYYIDDCQKMRYKAKFGGEILDVTSLKYYELDRLKTVTNCNGLIAMSTDASPKEEIFIPPTNTIGLLDDKSNVAEHLYGVNGVGFAASEKTAKSLGGHFGLEFYNKQTDADLWKPCSDPYATKLPLVCPGLLPLRQVSEDLERGKLALLFRYCFILGESSQHLELFNFKDSEYGEHREHFLNLLRMFGAELFLNNKIALIS
ncbi:hypothetical protein OGAPHI_000444 [Ogataea philodendri]|uniref:arginyltransferase n=1 Tax=Ogataea philodendri TaxID=1378263 RepID=A0A9P8PI07_9ASCO|nr:uncharacterized protein OGAPHI_000444 [Ogataea philodendri]KAH3671739.1 hypothetical protein OGAPHI_000444 [Ogataea philodendri]